MTDLTQPYQKLKRRSVTNWPALLDACILLGVGATDEMKDKASEWVTCACGNQCAALPRDADGSPQDSILYDLGINFSDQVANDNLVKAKKTLERIEKRSTKLLKKVLLAEHARELEAELNEINKQLGKR